MDDKVYFLKQLALKVTSATSLNEVTGDTICEVLDYIVKNYQEGSGTQGPKGDKGDTGEQGPQGEKGDTGAAGKDGKSVTSISLTTDETGKVTGGIVTFSDSTTSAITVSQAGV